MKLKFYHSRASTITISKDGTIRFKKNICDAYKIKIGGKIKVAVNEEEKEKQHLYLVPTHDKDPFGFKVTNQAGAIIKVGKLLKKYSISMPNKAEYKDFEHEGIVGIELTFKI